MKRRLYAGELHHVRAWFQTATAVCLPVLICSETYTDFLEVECDVLTNWVLENCAHNYARFQGELKSLKKRIRKQFALTMSLDGVECPGFMTPYLRAMRMALDRSMIDGPAGLGRFVLLWTQTRATGMADPKMIRDSLEKFEATVSDAGTSVHLEPEVVRKVCTCAVQTTGVQAKVSVGPTSCLESSRAKGGKTAYLSHLARHRCVRARYDYQTLEETLISPVPVRSAKDLVDWAVYVILHNPTYTSCVRVHGVAEPSKARTITVAPYAYQVLMGVFAHIFQPSLTARQVRSGLTADRHLWRFLTDVLNPQNKDWGSLIDENVYSLSTDLSEATDWGNRAVARQIWQALIVAANNPDFPLGLAVLAKTKYCGKRFAFLPDGSGNYKLVIANRGWLMGDMMTKVILTLAHQYCCELSGLSVYTLVGDDEIALDSDRRRLERHLQNLGLIFKVSELDTFISQHFAFYCEEGSLVPQKVQDTPHVRMRRGQELDYLDYPRIRLLLPQVIETDAYSMTNIGRFALLGKETRWVHSVNTPACPYFDRAGLLQHILVPQEPDTLCPYTPLEIGGDGGFPYSPAFAAQVINDKSSNPRETLWRLSDLLNNKFGHKFVRTDRLDKVVNKYHLYLPKITKLREILPPESILDASEPAQRALFTSFKHSTIKDPQTVFFDIARGLYYQALLQGKTPVEPTFTIDRQFSAGHTHEPTLDLHMFLETWKNPGFKFQDFWGYFVDTTKISTTNPMNLGWDWSEHRRTRLETRKVLDLWVKENVNLQDQSLPHILEMIREKKPLPSWMVSRLNLFIESDTYILHVLDRSLAEQEVIGLITRDQRLSLMVKRKLDAWRPQINHVVVCINPAYYLIGRMGEVEALCRPLGKPVDWSMPVIEDPGAMLYVDYTEFDDGFPLDEGIWDHEIVVRTTRRGATIVP